MCLGTKGPSEGEGSLSEAVAPRTPKTTPRLPHREEGVDCPCDPGPAPASRSLPRGGAGRPSTVLILVPVPGVGGRWGEVRLTGNTVGGSPGGAELQEPLMAFTQLPSHSRCHTLRKPHFRPPVRVLLSQINVSTSCAPPGPWTPDPGGPSARSPPPGKAKRRSTHILENLTDAVN